MFDFIHLDMAWMLITILAMFVVYELGKRVGKRNAPANYRAAYLMACCVLALSAGLVLAASPKGFNGRMKSNASWQAGGRSFQVDDAWGTKLKGIKAGTVTYATGATSRSFVTTGTLPSSIAIVTPRGTYATMTKYWATCSTDSMTIGCDASPAANLDFNFHIDGV